MISLDSTQARPSNTLAVNRFLLILGGGGAFLKNARSISNKMGYDPFFETSYFFFLFSLGTTEQIK
jgi:hypothetical protein